MLKEGVFCLASGYGYRKPVRIENTGVRSVREIIIVSTMSPFFIALLALVASTFRTRASALGKRAVTDLGIWIPLARSRCQFHLNRSFLPGLRALWQREVKRVPLPDPGQRGLKRRGVVHRHVVTARLARNLRGPS